MTNSKKFKNVNSRVPMQFGISRPIRLGLAALSLPMILSACATEAQFLAQNAPIGPEYGTGQRAIRAELPAGKRYSAVTEGDLH